MFDTTQTVEAVYENISGITCRVCPACFVLTAVCQGTADENELEDNSGTIHQILTFIGPRDERKTRITIFLPKNRDHDPLTRFLCFQQKHLLHF